MRSPACFVALLTALLAAMLMGGCGYTRPPSADVFRDCADCPDMVTIPAGSFLMGTSADQRLTDPRTGKPATNDGPQHRVTISKPFAIGQTEITVGQFAAFMADTNYQTVDRCMEFSKPNSFEIRKDINWGNTGFTQSPAHPVVCISYYDAAAYADWLGVRTGKNYRLPTEAEWEYAARAGSATPYFWGDDTSEACRHANVRSSGADAISTRQATADNDIGFPCDDGFTQSAPAASFLPNDFGLYDMQGNAWEWVSDCNHKDYNGAPGDGTAWLEESGKECRFGIIRGGSFLNLTERSSVTVRAGRPRSGAATNMGFRVALGGTPVRDRVAQREWSEGTTGETAAGAKLFAANCAACHINSDDFEGLYGTDRQALVQTISDGGNNVMSMPAFADRLSTSEIAVLADYLRRVNGWQ